MSAIGYLIILVGGLLVRQVAVGRVKELPDDMRDAAVAFLSGDAAGIGEAFSRRGSNVDAALDVGDVGGTGDADIPDKGVGTVSHGGIALKNEMVKLGTNARGYNLSATGPSYYDCSGLVWRAARNLGLFKGPRFTTSSFTAGASSWCKRVASPSTGDIVLWEGHHIGVCVGGDTMYSARSPENGIGESSISEDSRWFTEHKGAGPPTFWRVN